MPCTPPPLPPGAAALVPGAARAQRAVQDFYSRFPPNQLKQCLTIPFAPAPQFYPAYMETFLKLDSVIKKADAIRYFIMHAVGGERAARPPAESRATWGRARTAWRASAPAANRPFTAACTAPPCWQGMP